MSTPQEVKLTLEDLVLNSATDLGITSSEDLNILMNCIKSDEFKMKHDEDIKKIDLVLKEVNKNGSMLEKTNEK